MAVYAVQTEAEIPTLLLQAQNGDRFECPTWQLRNAVWAAAKYVPNAQRREITAAYVGPPAPPFADDALLVLSDLRLERIQHNTARVRADEPFWHSWEVGLRLTPTAVEWWSADSMEAAIRAAAEVLRANPPAPESEGHHA